jgi:hypothetical protein
MVCSGFFSISDEFVDVLNRNMSELMGEHSSKDASNTLLTNEIDYENLKRGIK